MDRYKITLAVIFLTVWVWSAINPPSYSYWLLENVPVFAALLLFILLRRHIKLSNVSYTLILLYMFLPLVTFRYGVTGVPFGNTLAEWLGASRNVYDKVVHFGFGFFGFYPVAEFMMSLKKKAEEKFNYYFPFITILALAGLYEIFEWLAAILVNPTLASQFYGAQGDIFDSQKDMAVASIGALLAMLITFLVRKYRKI